MLSENRVIPKSERGVLYRNITEFDFPKLLKLFQKIFPKYSVATYDPQEYKDIFIGDAKTKFALVGEKEDALIATCTLHLGWTSATGKYTTTPLHNECDGFIRYLGKDPDFPGIFVTTTLGLLILDHALAHGVKRVAFMSANETLRQFVKRVGFVGTGEQAYNHAGVLLSGMILDMNNYEQHRSRFVSRKNSFS